jgi:hemerythrin-like domain-containing protein
MEPIGPLMKEHRLIEKVVDVVRQSLAVMRETGRVDLEVERAIVDFFRVYADRLHHGKEEDILFRALEKKSISAEHRKTMERLVEDHKRGRKLIAGLGGAIERYAAGASDTLERMADIHQDLVLLYPAHIAVEDGEFFYPVTEYFSREERDRMVEESEGFDKEFIHQLYRDRVGALSKKTGEPESE